MGNLSIVAGNVLEGDRKLYVIQPTLKSYGESHFWTTSKDISFGKPSFSIGTLEGAFTIMNMIFQYPIVIKKYVNQIS